MIGFSAIAWADGSAEAAKRWLANNRYNRAYLEDVSADQVGADVIEGRTAA